MPRENEGGWRKNFVSRRKRGTAENSIRLGTRGLRRPKTSYRSRARESHGQRGRSRAEANTGERLIQKVLTIESGRKNVNDTSAGSGGGEERLGVRGEGYRKRDPEKNVH